MKMFRQQKFLFALLAILALFAGCKGESPTAPPLNNGGGSTPGGGTPATGTVITVSFSNTSPVVGSPVTVSVSVTQNGAAVPNGTAVELASSLGTFTDNGAATTIRTTTNGVATAVLNSGAPGTATVVATINNVAKSGTVTFRAEQTTPVPTPTTPTITAVTPTFGSPNGGQTVTITGTNFTAPVRVFFDFGNNTAPVEAFVLPGSTSTQIQVLTPQTNLGAGQTKQATIIVIASAGSANEQRATSQPFTFAAEQLTPSLTTVSPASGPINGGTRVTIFGEAFQAPVQVFFGSQEAQVINVQFNQIVVLSPAGRDTSPNGGTTVTGPVDVRVINVASNKSASLASVFRYTPKSQITAITPGRGTAFGGTDVTIDGTGFDDPVTVSIAGIPATVLRVSGTQILARTGRTPVPCSPPSAAIIVTNVENGDQGTGPIFTYNPEKPIIVSVSPNPVGAGGTLSVVVDRPGVGVEGTGVIRFTLGGRVLPSAPTTITDPLGPTTFSVTVPSNLTFPDISCTSGNVTGTQKGPLIQDLTFLNVTTSCTDVATGGVTINPPGPNPCVVSVPPVASVSPTSFCPPSTPFPATTVGSSTANLLTVSNTAPAANGQNLIVSSITVTGANAGDFSVTPTTLSVPAGQSAPVTITFTPSAPGTRTATATLFTNDTTHSSISVCLQGTGTP